MITSFHSNSGRLIALRTPLSGDETILFQFAKTLEKEDAYVLLNPEEPVTWEEEVKYLDDVLRRINVGWQVHVLAFHNSLLIGSAQISLQGRRKKHVGAFGITLLPEYRSDGIGKELAKVVLGEAKEKLGINLVTLELFSKNTIAHRLYERLGFLEYGNLPKGLSRQGVYDNAVLMYKVL